MKRILSTCMCMFLSKWVSVRGDRAEGAGEMGEWDEEVQAPSYKINKSWGVMYSLGDSVNHIVITVLVTDGY